MQPSPSGNMAVLHIISIPNLPILFSAGWDNYLVFLNTHLIHQVPTSTCFQLALNHTARSFTVSQPSGNRIPKPQQNCLFSSFLYSHSSLTITISIVQFNKIMSGPGTKEHINAHVPERSFYWVNMTHKQSTEENKELFKPAAKMCALHPHLDAFSIISSHSFPRVKHPP